jgi:hypothetical protein
MNTRSYDIQSSKKRWRNVTMKKDNEGPQLGGGGEETTVEDIHALLCDCD